MSFVTWLMLQYSVHCHMVNVTIFSPLSHGYCYNILYIVTWLLLPYYVHCHMVNVTIFCTLSHGYCYHILYIVTWLLLPYSLHCHMVIVIKLCPLSHVLAIVSWMAYLVVMYIRLGEQNHGDCIRNNKRSYFIHFL